MHTLTRLVREVEHNQFQNILYGMNFEMLTLKQDFGRFDDYRLVNWFEI